MSVRETTVGIFGEFMLFLLPRHAATAQTTEQTLVSNTDQTSTGAYALTRNE